MGRGKGITKDTYQRIILDSGAVYVNYGLGDDAEELLGATRGGSEFSVETEYKQMDVDGAPGPVTGDLRILSVTATLTANFIEISPDILKKALPGSDKVEVNDDGGEVADAGTGTYYEIKRKVQSVLLNSSYFDNIAIAANISGSNEPVICGIKNAIANSNFQLSFADKDESVLTITFRGSFDPDSLDEEPWFIRYPKLDSVASGGD